MQDIIVFPFVTILEDLTIGQHTFWSIRRALRERVPDPIAQSNVSRFLGIYKEHSGRPLTDGIAALVGSQEEYESLKDALLALKYLAIEEHSRSRFSPDVYDDHFYHHGAPILNTEITTFTLFDATGTLSGVTAEETGRCLPGSLTPVSIRKVDQNAANLLYDAIHKEDRVKYALNWYCKAMRWQNDRLDAVLALCVAFEVLYQIRSRRKSRELSRKTRQLVLDNPHLSMWVKHFYRTRNKITHEGKIHPTKWIYFDRMKNPVLAHDDIAKTLFHEAIRTITHPSQPSSDFQQSIREYLKSDRVLGKVLSNATKAWCIEYYLGRPSLTPKQVARLMQLCSMIAAQDFSLTSEECMRYMRLFHEKANQDSPLCDSVYESYVRRGLKNVITELTMFRSNLDAGIYRLPAL